MSLELLGAGAGAGQGLEQLIAQRRAEELMRQQALVHALSAIGLRDDRQARLAQQKNQADALAESRSQTNKSRMADVNLRQLQTLSPGTTLGPSSFERMTNPETGAALPEQFDASQGTPASLPSTSLSGLMPIDRGQSGVSTMTPEKSLKLDPSYRFKGTAQQQDRGSALDLREAMMKANQGNQDWKNSIAQQLADQKAASGGASPHFQLQPEVDPKTGAQTGKFLGYDTKSNRFEPIGGITPQSTKAAPGAAAAATNDRTKAETLDTLNQLDRSIDAAKDLIGPGAGRVSSLEQMIGSADPRIQALGVKMKATKMRVDHALTGSVRAGASPMLMKQWDNILANNVTPEGLKAGVQAMRELIGGSDASASAGRPKFEILSVK